MNTHHPAKAPSQSPTSPTPLTILVVDDDEDYRLILKRCLEKLGYHSLMAKDGVDALNMLDIQPRSFAAVISDIIMPRMNGVDLAHAIAAFRYPVPVILMSTSLAQTGYSNTDLSNAADRYMNKPVSLEDTCEKLKVVLDDLLIRKSS